MELHEQINKLLNDQEERVDLARRQVAAEITRRDLEAQRVDELRKQNEHAARTLAQEAKWQEIEQRRIAQIDAQTQRVQSFSAQIADMRGEHARILTAIKDCKAYLETVVRILQILAEKVIAPGEREESRAILSELIRQMKSETTIIGAVSAERDALIAGKDIK